MYYEVITVSSIFGENVRSRIETDYQPHIDAYREMRGQPFQSLVSRKKAGGHTLTLSTFVIRTYKDTEWCPESRKEVLSTAFRQRGHMHSPVWSYLK